MPDPASTAPSARTPVKETRRLDWLDRLCERGILGLILCILVFGPLAFGAVDAPGLLAIQSFTIGAVVLWVIRCWASKSFRLLWAPTCWAVVAVVIYAVVRYRMLLAEGGVEYLARQELIQVLIYAGLFFVVLNNLSRQEPTQMITVVLCCLGTALSLYALYQFLTKSRHVLWAVQDAGYFGRGSGTYVCPNHLAGLLEMILPLGLAMTLGGRFKPTAKVFLGYAALAIFAGIGVTLSRGAWVTTGLSLAVLFGLLLRQRGRRLAGMVFLVLLVAGFMFFVKNMGALQRRIDVALNENKLDVSRFELWRPAIRMWRDHPWWGVGLAQFDERFRAYRPDDIQMRPGYAHNDYLNTLADWGAVGVTLIAAAIVLLYLGVFQSWKYVLRSSDLSARQSNRSAFVLGAAVGLFAILVHSAVDFNMHVPANAIVAVTLIALLAGHVRFATERYWFKLGLVGKPVLTVVCAAWVAYLGAQGVQRGREALALRHAALATDLQTKVSALEAAYAAEPNNADTTYVLGETLRRASWQGVGNYRELAAQALPWFERGMKLDPFNPFSFLSYGMCLHWLERPQEAGRYFDQALALDPRNYRVLSQVGWHFLQLGDWALAKNFYEKAVFQAHWDPEYRLTKYQDGLFYLNVIERRQAEQKAAGH